MGEGVLRNSLLWCRLFGNPTRLVAGFERKQNLETINAVQRGVADNDGLDGH